MKIDTRTTPLLQRAVTRHLAEVEGLRGVQVFVGRNGEWTEATRRGDVPPEAHTRVLASFNPTAGGAVEALDGPRGGWLGTYMLGRAGLDLVVILSLVPLDPSQLQQRLVEIEAKIGWIMVAALSDRHDGTDSRAVAGEIGPRLLLDAAAARSRKMLADQWIARLEAAFGPDLIAVLWVRADNPELTAISGGGLIERPSDARADLETLAKTAIAERAPLLLSDAASPLARPGDEKGARSDDAAEAWAVVERLGARTAAVLPIQSGDRTESVVVMLYAAESPEDAPRLEGAEVVGALLAEALAVQERAHPRILRRVRTWISDGARAVFGKTAWKLKMAFVLLIAALIVASQVTSNYRPAFTARVEAGDRRIVSAPFDGFLAAADYQLGDRVEAGTLLVGMEDSEFRLRQAQLRAELGEVEAELQTARAQRNAVQVRLLEARRAQTEAQLDLVARQLSLARFEVAQPAIVVGGDAWRRVGDRVRLGEPLMELAAPDSFRITAFIEEDWIAAASEGALGTALLTAYPDRPIEVRLVDIGADPRMVDGANAFPARFEIAEQVDAEILDGMRGVVRLDVGEQSALAAYSRGLSRWAERALWRMGLGGGEGA